MSTISQLDVDAELQNIIAALLRRYLPNTTVWAYGSRVKGMAKPYSDLDLVAFTTKEQAPAVADLKEAFEESDLPFRVDLFVWDELPESFHANIEQEKIILQKADDDLGFHVGEHIGSPLRMKNDLGTGRPACLPHDEHHSGEHIEGEHIMGEHIMGEHIGSPLRTENGSGTGRPACLPYLEKLLDGADVVWKPLEDEDFFEIANNKRKPIKASLRMPGKTPYFGANNIQDYVNGHTHDGEYVLIAEDGSASLENYSIQYTTGKFWANNHVHVVRGKDNVNTRFLYYFLRTVNFLPYLANKDRSKLTKGEMVKIPIPIPCPDEPEKSLAIQAEIVRIRAKLLISSTSTCNPACWKVDL